MIITNMPKIKNNELKEVIIKIAKQVQAKVEMKNIYDS